MSDSITRERWRTIEPLLDGALALEPASRPGWLAERCGGDAELQAAVERLAAAFDEAQQVLPSGAPDAVLALTRLAEAEAAREGTRLGPYLIVREAGRGGMGVVYEAERADDQYRKRVALKLLRRGMDDPHLVRRFLEERQILATLDHPHIARLLDGGITGDRMPWFAMEYVEGEPIDRYCDGHRLTVDQRLRLFLAVCDAVQYAHRNLVVHRDLKPSNVLVTPDGQIKLLDFGVAKLMAPGQAAEATVTQVGHRALTPEYASPEQLRGEPVTVASDVYSLAVVLYGLLTGRLPYRLQSRLARDLEQAVLEEAVTAPSAAAATNAGAAAARSSSPERLGRRLRGDLDMIILMALRKEPERRYQSVEALATDIRGHLDGLPVQAQADRWSYRAAKFLRRHTAAVAAAAGLVLLVGGFGVLSAIQSARTTKERDRAEQVSAFVTDLLGSPDPYRGQRADVTVRQVLDSAVLRIRSELRAQPVLQADLLAVIGRSYYGLGLLPQARSALDSAIRLRRRAGDEGRALAEDEGKLAAVVMLSGGERRERDSLVRAALRTARRVLTRNDTALASILVGTATSLSEGNSDAEAQANLAEAIGILGRAPHPNPLAMADALAALGDRRWAAGDYPGAETLYVKALGLRRSRLGPDHPDVGELSASLGFVLGREGKPEAARYLREGIATLARALGPDHANVVSNERMLADLLVRLHDLGPAESLYTKVAEAGRRMSPAGHFLTVDATYGLATVALQRGDSARAEAYLKEAIGIAERITPPNERYGYGAARLALAQLRAARGDYAGAESLMVDVLAAARLEWDEGSPRIRSFKDALAGLYEAWGKPELARRYRQPQERPGATPVHGPSATADSTRRF
jgi:eukaryotic-like serine/threonine-protein kinase